MKLQKMRYLWDGEIVEVVCAVNLSGKGGEFTVCGSAIPDSDMEHDDFERVGPEFIGRLKDVTCSNCLNVIYFMKSLK